VEENNEQHNEMDDEANKARKECGEHMPTVV
jgi:hypothetical protein